MNMRKTLLAAAALAAFLSIGAAVKEAAAMPATSPVQLGLATSADNSLIQKAGCGYYGCWYTWWSGPYWHHPYWGWRPHYWGWHPHNWGWHRW
jgi:hypothetical protein